MSLQSRTVHQLQAVRSKLTPRPLTTVSIALFLFFAIPAVGLAIDICQRTPKVSDHMGHIGGPSPPPDQAQEPQIPVPGTPPTVVAFGRLPVIELFITSAAIVLS